MGVSCRFAIVASRWYVTRNTLDIEDFQYLVNFISFRVTKKVQIFEEFVLPYGTLWSVIQIGHILQKILIYFDLKMIH